MKCLDEGTLQAYLDRELPGARMRVADGHLEACAACRARMGRIETTAGRVNAWLDALAPVELPSDPAAQGAVPRIGARNAGLRWRWAWVPLAGALAASAALFFANAPAPKKEAHVQERQAPLADARGSVDVAPRRATTVRKRVRKSKPRPALDGFVALEDADPMQMGMVVRVMLPVSDASMGGSVQEIAADLVIGEDGRARAIRLVR